ncbi:MAG TPA: N-acetylglucosamine-6-phosphate deacetylase [Acholeplasma sp.]|nr:N-acetylglucosamine-6-phosphate deacetylase [Acholeplasma sp.]
MISCIKNVHIVLENEIVFGSVQLEDGKIKSIIKHDEPNSNGDEFFYLVPGFIDVHIHGSNGHDAMDHQNKDAVEQMALSLVKEGTTAFLPTTMTQTVENITKSLAGIKTYYDNQNKSATKVLGIHLEGPFINVLAAGAQPKACVVYPTIAQFDAYNKASGHLIKKVSVAPEVQNGLELIRHLKDNHIIASIAHTKATYEIVKEALKAGATSLTHTYNAMTPLHHRDVGVVGAALLHNELSSELIFDKIHVCVEASKILFNAKGEDNIILITDSMRAKWLEEGISELGGQKVYIKNNEARLEDGTLAGSILKMIDGYKNLVNDLSLSLPQASKLASANPAKQLNVFDQMGSITEGKCADLVLLDSNLNIKQTIIDGHIVYKG